MRRLFPVAVAAFLLAVVWVPSRAEEPTTERTDPKLPDIPGPFHPYNVTGRYKGHFHSRISEYGLEPMVMIFTRQVDFSEPLKNLLTQIDATVEKNPGARLRPFVVVQSDDLPDLAGLDEKQRAELAKELQAGGLDEKQRAELDKKLDAENKADDLRLELEDKLGKEHDALKLQHVDIDLAGKADLEKFNLDDAGFAFFLFQRGNVTASRVLGKDVPLTDADVKAIVALHLAPFGPENTAVVVTRDAALSDPLKDLLRRIDDAAEKNPAARLRPVLALLSDDPKRNDAAADLEKALMLKHVEVVAAGASELEAMVRSVPHLTAPNTPEPPVDVNEVGFAFILLQQGKVTGGGALKKDEQFPDLAKQVMTTLAEKAKADKQ